MNYPGLEKWLDIVRRRPLSAAERSQFEDFLAHHPEARLAWSEEETLTHWLAGLPDAPVSPDFTARVMDATGPWSRGARSRSFAFPWLRLPRPAVGFVSACLAILLGLAGFLIQQKRSQTRLVSSVADLSRQIELAGSISELPPVQLLQDFDAIFRLSQPQSLPDDELLAALQ